MSDQNLFRRVWDAFADTAKSIVGKGEVAHSDPFRLVPIKGFTRYNPDIMITRKGYKVIDEMRDDDQVKACMSFKKLSVISSGYTIASPGEQAKDWDVTEFVRAEIENLPGTFNHAVLEIMSAMEYGFSVTEKVYREIEHGRFKGKVGYMALKTRRPHFFGFEQDKYGNVLNLKQFNSESGYGDGADLPIDKFVVYSYMEEFDNPYGNSDLRAAYRYYWAKDQALRWLMMMLEKFGIPPIFGLYDPNEIQGAQLDALKTIFNRLQAATNALIPALNGEDQAFKIEFPEVAGQVASVFEPALNRFDTAIARALLMPGLLGMSPDQVSGSLARSKTSFDMFMLMLEYLRSEMEDLVNEQIVKPIVDFNYNVDEYPKFSMNPIDDDVRMELLKQWTEMIDKGVVTPSEEDEPYIRDMFGFPERKDDDDLDRVDPEPDPEPDDDDDDDEDDEELIRQNKFRETTSYEKRVNFTTIGAIMEKTEVAVVKKVANQTADGVDKIIAKIRRAGVTLETIRSINKLATRAKIKSLLQSHLIETFTAGRDDFTSETNKIKQFAEAGSPNYIPTLAIQALRDKAIEIAGTINNVVIDAVKKSLTKSLEVGDSTQAAVDRLDKKLKPLVGRPGVTLDAEDLTPHRLETIVRTESTFAYNQGRLVEGRRKGIVDNMRGFQYSAILDSRTSPVCQSLDGKIFKIGDASLDTLRPPNHHNCRSILVPVTVFDDVADEDFITPKQIGSSIELANEGFV